MSPTVSRRLLALAAWALLALLAWPGAAAAANTFSGRAKVVDATVLGVNTVLVDTGPVAAGGGELNETLLELAVPGVLTGEVGHASVVAGGKKSSAEASVASLALTVGGQAISADFLQARATAECTGNTATVSGGSELAGLNINGQEIAVTGAPNQAVALPLVGGEVIINEQIGGASADRGDLTVNALHVIIPGVADVVIAQAHADIVCAGPPACPTTKDFVTGGGWIVTPSGSRGTFGVAGGIKNNGLWGHLTYIDHGAQLKVKGLGVTAYAVTGPTSRHIEGRAEINGVPGTYAVDVADNGEPGRGKDVFRITLSNGYTAGGPLGGGNIQLHKPCK